MKQKGVGVDSCKLCGSKLDEVEASGPLDLLYRAECPKCGVYIITDRAEEATPDPFIKDRLHLISAVTRWNSERGSRLRVEEKLLIDRPEFEAKILSVCPRNVQEKMDVILRYIADKASYPGDMVEIHGETDHPLFYCAEKKEFEFYVDYLRDMELVVHSHSDANYSRLILSPKGWIRVQELAKPNIESKQAFVAMRFNDEMKAVFLDGIAKLEENTGFTMHRVDMEESNDKICDRIIADIRKSRFLIADVTWHRQAVYFEAGFALGLGLPVIWTCREDQKKRCSFDTRQYNHIFWIDANDLRKQLGDRIVATIGKPLSS